MSYKRGALVSLSPTLLGLDSVWTEVSRAVNKKLFQNWLDIIILCWYYVSFIENRFCSQILKHFGYKNLNNMLKHVLLIIIFYNFFCIFEPLDQHMRVYCFRAIHLSASLSTNINLACKLLSIQCTVFKFMYSVCQALSDDISIGRLLT